MFLRDLSAAIQAERTREAERRSHEWRLLHPEPVEEVRSLAAPTAIARGQIAAARQSRSAGSACEAV